MPEMKENKINKVNNLLNILDYTYQFYILVVNGHVRLALHEFKGGYQKSYQMLPSIEIGGNFKK